MAPGSLQGRDPLLNDGGVCGRRWKWSQAQSTPYSSELGRVWDRETVQASRFSSGARQEDRRNRTRNRTLSQGSSHHPQPVGPAHRPTRRTGIGQEQILVTHRAVETGTGQESTGLHPAVSTQCTREEAARPAELLAKDSQSQEQRSQQGGWMEGGRAKHARAKHGGGEPAACEDLQTGGRG